MHEGVAQEGIIHNARFGHESQPQTHDALQKASTRKRAGTTRLGVNGERDAIESAALAF